MLYHETQKRLFTWVYVLVLGIAALIWWMTISQIVLDEPVGNNPPSDPIMVAFWVIFGLGFPAMMFMIRLTIRVDSDAVRIRMFPFVRRDVPLANIESVQARQYNPLWEFGGWGIRNNLRRTWAYSMRGNTGVELRLTDGRGIMLGTPNPDALADAIRNAQA